MPTVTEPSAVVQTFYTVEEAELARANLEGAGIRARLEGKHATSVLPLHALALGGVRVVVRTEELALAREVLGIGAEVTSEPTEPAEEAAGDAWMRRASFAAFLGVSACPGVGTAYAAVLLLRYGGLPLSNRGRMHRRIAWMCCAITLAFLALWQLGVGR